MGFAAVSPLLGQNNDAIVTSMERFLDRLTRWRIDWVNCIVNLRDLVFAASASSKYPERISSNLSSVVSRTRGYLMRRC
jgi:hypothetical protein